MTTALTPHFVVSDDELQVLGVRVGIGEFPTVLGVRPRHGTVDALTEAGDRATASLVDRGLIVDGAVSADLVVLLQALCRPHRELAVRLVTPEGRARISVVRRGNSVVLARRVNHEIALRISGSGADLATTSRMLIAELPRAEAAQITPVGAPLDTISEKLLGTHDSAQLADRIRAMGAEPRTAMVLGSALASRMAFAEIVYYSVDTDLDRLIRRPAAVGVFYTKRGRIVGAPSASPAGELWSTLKPGSDHAIAQAITQVVELSRQAWE